MLTKTPPAPPTPQKETARRDAAHNPRVDSAGMGDLLGFNLRMVYLTVSRHFAAAMAKFDLTQKQTGVLWLIGGNGGISQITLARELGMDRASMMAIVDRLESRQLLTRQRSKRDGRRQELHLTLKGERLLAQAKAAIAEHEGWMTERFTPDELDTLMHSLRRLQR